MTSPAPRNAVSRLASAWKLAIASPSLHGAVDAPDDEPRPEIRGGCLVAGLFFVVFLGWASIARLDAAAYASGQVTVAGHRQTVQHRDGGVVSALFVTEGAHVQAGQILLELAGSEVKAQQTGLAGQVLGLEAQRARLSAEQAGAAQIAWPPRFATLQGEDLQTAQRAMQVQQNQFVARSQERQAQKAIIQRRTAELGQQIEGYQRQIESLDQQLKLIADELAGTRSLADRGFAPLTRVRALERSQAEMTGQRGQYLSTVAQLHEQIGEARLQIMQVDKAASAEVASQLRDTEVQLNETSPKLAAADDQLERIAVRAPAAGTVVGLTAFTVGGVIAPGQKLMDIVPDKAALVIEAQVSPDDADDLHIGQSTEIRFTGVHRRDLPVVTGALTRLSADSFADEHTGARYFTAKIRVAPAELAGLEGSRGLSLALRPGMPVQVLIPLRKRTALQYLVEPLTDTFWRAFREH